MELWLIAIYFLTVMVLYKSVEGDDSPFDEQRDDELKFINSH